MLRFDRTWFGSVAIGGKIWKDVIVVGEEVIDRYYLGDIESHTISKKELDKLLEGKPEVIIIGTGQSGVLEVPKEIVRAIRQRSIELIVMETPDAIQEYNELSKTKRVNALIHTTC